MKTGMLFFIPFISIFFGVGIWMVYSGVSDYQKGRSSLSWPRTTAVLNECDIVEKVDDGTTWKVAVKYSYSIAGVEHEGDTLAFGYGASNNKTQHETIYDKLKGAKEIEVRYNPANPNVSVIAAGMSKSNLTLLVFGITWLLFTTGFTVMFFTFHGQDTNVLNQISIIR